MPTLDPDAATAAYLATMSAAAHAKAIAYTRGGEWMTLWGWLVTVLAAAAILWSGVLPRIRDRIQRTKPRPNLVVLGCVLAFALIDTVMELPWTIYGDWWRERSYGLSSQPFGQWAGEAAISSAIGLIVMAVLALAIYALIRRAPRTWWAWSAGVTVILIVFMTVLSPIVIEPIFNTYTPAPPGPTRDAVVALAEQAGVPHDKIYIYDGSRQSNRYTANVSGLFGTARIAMSDTMFARGADLAEVRAVLAHEMGHYVQKIVLISAVFFSVLAVICFFAIDRLFPRVARRLPGGEKVAGVADPAGAPVFAVVLATVGLLMTPFLNSFIRFGESWADSFSVQTAHEPDGMARALMKTVEYRAASPNPVEEFLFYDHPSVSRRIHAAMTWKAQHPELVGK